MTSACIMLATSPAGAWSLSPGIDPVLITAAVLAMIALSLAEWRARRQPILLALLPVRAAAAGMLAAILAGPSASIVPVAPIRPSVTLLVDHSRSMSIPDDEAGCARLAAAQRAWLGKPYLDELAARADIDAFVVADDSHRSPLADLAALAPDGRQSRLAEALARAMSGVRAGLDRPAHILLFSDGVDTDRRPLLSRAAAPRGASPAVHAVIPGDGAAAQVARVEAWFDAGWVNIGEPATIHVEASAPPDPPDGLRLIVREHDESGRIVAERAVAPSESARLDIAITPDARVEPGGVASVRYIASLESASARAPVASDSAFVQVTGRRLRVLVLEGEPSWDTRFFVDALAAEPDIEVCTIMALGPAGDGSPRTRITRIIPGPERTTRRIGGPAPTHPSDLAEFDLIVLGHAAMPILSPEGAAALPALIRERGGGILWLRGVSEALESNSWRALSPAESVDPPSMIRGATMIGPSGEPIAPAVKELRRSTPALRPAAGALWQAIFPLLGETEVLCADMPLGAGRAAAVFAEGFWRIGAQNPEAGAAMRREWVALAMRLAHGGDRPAGAAGSLALSRTEAEPGATVTATLRLRSPDVDLSRAPLRIIAPDGRITEAPLTRDPDAASPRWTATFRPEAEGDFTVRAMVPESDARPPVTLESGLSVRQHDAEMRETMPRRADLAALAEQSGGRVWTNTESDARRFLTLLEREALARQGTARQEPVWDEPWVFIVLIGVCGVEWWCRRRWGFA